jgi:hypothetical protein
LKIILDYLFLHLKTYPQWGFYGIFALFLAFSLWFRYGYGFNPSFNHSAWAGWWGGLFYATPYFFSLGLYSIFYQKFDFWFDYGFWGLSALILGVLYVNQYLLFYKNYLPQLPFQLVDWVGKLSFNLHSIFFYLLIPHLYLFFASAMQKTHFYGCTSQNFYGQIYFLMLILMFPLLIWASFRPDFLQTYPRYKPFWAENYWQISPVITVSIYELTYILQFIALEIFFRGFVVMALAQYVGGASVFAMVAVYCFLHFFKPLPEAIGSIFGGYVLGVIAFYSRSVLGGMCIHIGVALLMELLAFAQIYWRAKE